MEKTDHIEKFQDHSSTSGTSVLMESAIAPSGQTINVAYYSQVIRGLQRYKNVFTKRKTGLCSLYKKCLYHNNSNTKIYLALFLHITIIIVDFKYHNNFLKIALLFRMKLNSTARFVCNLRT